MTDANWRIVWKLFRDLCELPESERPAAIAAASLEPELRSELEALLEQSVSFVSPASAAPDPGLLPAYPPGAEFGRYFITGQLGHGGFGRVYAARDKDLGRTVAIKVLASKPRGNEQLEFAEARAASALNHPNILTVYDTVDLAGHAGMVTEFVQGECLRAVLKKAGGPLPLHMAIHYCRQIAEALRAAHAEGLAHRDVKPENIVVRPDGYVKLVDFGLAVNLSDREMQAGGVSGTLRYMAPEQARGKGASAFSDVFSLGLVFYEMVTGGHPFARATPLETAEAIASEAPAPPNQKAPVIPAAVNRLILSMLEKDPARRPTAAQVSSELAATIAQSPRRSAVLPMVLAAAALIALVLGLWRPWRPPASPGLTALKATPLTRNGGHEDNLSISSDGRFVFYDSRERPGGPVKKLVREISSGITSEHSIPGPLTWIPGTDRIAFTREGANGERILYTIPRTGEPEERLFAAKGLGQVEWSRDRRFVAYVILSGVEQRGAIYLFDVATGEHRQITFPPPGTPGESRLALSPDGKRVAFRRWRDAVSSDIYVSDFPNAKEPRQLSSMNSPGGGLVWLRDGTSIVASTFHGAYSSLWLHSLNSSGPPVRLTNFGSDAKEVSAADNVNRLAWVNSLDDTNIWRVPAAGGKPERFIDSLMRDADVSASSTGVLAFRSDRTGFSELWIAGPEGEPQKRVTTLEGLTGSPRWSPDGRRLAFDSRRGNANGEIFVLDCESSSLQCGEPRQLTIHESADALPGWSRDGAFVYFASLRSGEWQVWRVRVDASDRRPERITTAGGFFAMESPDREWLYYSRIDSPETTGIWRQRLDAKVPFESPGEMVTRLEYRSTATWSLHGSEIFYQTVRPPGQPASIEAFDIGKRRKRVVYEAGDAPIARGMAVSADGKWVYFSRTDRSQSTIVYADY